MALVTAAGGQVLVRMAGVRLVMVTIVEVGLVMPTTAEVKTRVSCGFCVTFLTVGTVSAERYLYLCADVGAVATSSGGEVIVFSAERMAVFSTDGIIISSGEEMEQDARNSSRGTATFPVEEATGMARRAGTKGEWEGKTVCPRRITPMCRLYGEEYRGLLPFFLVRTGGICATMTVV